MALSDAIELLDIAVVSFQSVGTGRHFTGGVVPPDAVELVSFRSVRTGWCSAPLERTTISSIEHSMVTDWSFAGGMAPDDVEAFSSSTEHSDWVRTDRCSGGTPDDKVILTRRDLGTSPVESSS